MGLSFLPQEDATCCLDKQRNRKGVGVAGLFSDLTIQWCSTAVLRQLCAMECSGAKYPHVVIMLYKVDFNIYKLEQFITTLQVFDAMSLRTNALLQSTVLLTVHAPTSQDLRIPREQVTEASSALAARCLSSLLASATQA